MLVNAFNFERKKINTFCDCDFLPSYFESAAFAINQSLTQKNIHLLLSSKSKGESGHFPRIYQFF
jgi:hypothetical protein